MKGRPTKYTDDMPERVLEWLETQKDEFQKSEKGDEKLKVKLPNLRSLANYLGINLDTIHEWKKDESKKDFSDSIKAVLAEQHERLLNMGLSGDYNCTIAKLALCNNYGYRDKADLTSDDKEIKGVVMLPPKNES